MSVMAIKQDTRAANFAAKALMLGLSLEEQVELLNKMYKGEIQFKVHTDAWNKTSKIRILKMNNNIKILELPEVENLDYEILIENDYSHIIDTIKFPKCMPKISCRSLGQLYKFRRIWCWDDSLVDINELQNKHNNVEMLVVQYSDGRKPKVYRF